jgi:trimethylamine--corrinoid protein Co-methyltransferase
MKGEHDMSSQTPDIIPFPLPLRCNLLSQSQLEKLKEGTLTLLDEVGIHFPSRKALEIFADHGASVNMDTQIVRIPAGLVKKAMSTAPRSFVLAGREKRFDLRLNGSCSYLCPAGTAPNFIDPETRVQRPSRKEDLARMARICDALPLISFVWSIITSQDHGRTSSVHDCHAMLTNTLKHVRGGTTMHPKLARYVVEMATIVAGSDEERRRRPPINANICTIAPLAQDTHGIEAALTYAEAGIPVSFMAMTTMGSTAPATPLGALVVGDAEVVSAMILIQLAYPGAPVFHSVLVSLMDPRTGGYIVKVPSPVRIIATQLAHSWKVPCLGGGSMSTDALEIGWHSGTDGGLASSLIALSGAEISGFLGLLGGAMILYPEKIILDHETCQCAYELLSGFDFQEADMALEIIKQVGPRGHFLVEKHTRQHIRDFRCSPLLRQKAVNGGFRDPREVAFEEFKRINQTHHPEPLPKEVLAELDIILASADREAEKMP